MDLINIAKSWIIARNPTEEQKEKAESRIKICNSCDFSSKILGAEICNKCGCPLSKKIFSPRGPEECPEKFWTV